MRFGFLPVFLLPTVAVAGEIQFSEGVARPINSNPRTVLRVDSVEADLIAGRLDTSSWKPVAAGQNGVFSGQPFGSGYALFKIESDSEKFMLLEAKGNGVVYANGVPRAGDVYSFGYLSLPVKLKKGTNEFLFTVARGSFSAKLVDPSVPVSLDARDATLPDIVRGEKETLLGALVVRNATGEDLGDLVLEANGSKRSVGSVMAESSRKVWFSFKPNSTGDYTIKLLRKGKLLDQTKLKLRLREANQVHKRTFLSRIDDSVQYYAVNPAQSGPAGRAMALSLHGASVEALGQCEAYGPKQNFTVVCPTNRRPFGFDWEDVGRLDALEVLEQAQARFKPDPQQMYLTGHSMGGHGTWNIGALFPDRFAAIAPCAGWISFNTYAGGATYPDSPIGDMFRRAGLSSDTLAMKSNLLSKPIFINHGDADDNVPVTEARRMRQELAENKQLQWYEEKGGGHWYDSDPEPGASVEDFAPIFSLFAQARIPAANSVRSINFTTPNPYISSRCHWLMVNSQENIGSASNVQALSYPGLRKFVVDSTNIASLSLDASVLLGTGPVEVVWNGKTLKHEPINNMIKLGVDAQIGKGFKASLDNRVVLVYGTKGTQSENAWIRNKARFDAEQFWYRGNSGVSVMSDSEYAKSGTGRNALCYSIGKGNSVFNSAIDLPERSADSLLLRRVDEGGTSVSFFHASNLQAARLSERIPLFSAGVAIPDILVINPSMLKDGIKGVEAIGFTAKDLIWSK
ncbi:MAG: prolyl oligopeptidase family serine peptidase [Armatimonadota bacterium]